MFCFRKKSSITFVVLFFFLVVPGDVGDDTRFCDELKDCSLKLLMYRSDMIVLSVVDVIVVVVDDNHRPIADFFVFHI